MEQGKSTYRLGSAFFLNQIRQNRGFFLVMLVLTLGYSGMVSLTIFFLGRIVDGLVSGDTLGLFGADFALWVVFFVAFIVASLMQYVFSLTKDRLQAVLGSRIKKFYLSTRFAHILRLPFHYLKDKKKGELIGVTEEFASGFDSALNHVLGLLEITLRMAIFVVIIFVSVSYINGLVYLAGVVLAFAVSLQVARRYRSVVGERVDEVTATKGKSYDVINNYDVVKTFNKETREAGVLARIYGKLRGFELKENATYLRYNAVNLFIFQVFIFANLGVGFFLLSRGAISVGDVVNLQIYSTFLFGLIVAGADRYISVTGFLFGVGKSEEIFNLTEERYSADEAVVPRKFVGDVEFKNVWFKYPDGADYVLRDVSFTIGAGEQVAVTGTSGVGKTTMVNLLLGFYFPSKGEILVDGVSTKRLDLNFLRSNISVVSQEVGLFNDTIGNNIRYGALNGASEREVVASCEKAEIHDFIMGLPNRYDQIVGERGIKLSGGQKQRVGIARALVRGSKIIILDEPTSNLDSVTEEKIQAAFDNLLSHQTNLVIAHRLSTLKAADKILVFSEGRLVGQGKHAELIESNEEYHNLYELQMQK